MPVASHGSPYDRGEADAYYGRRFRPHKWLDPLGRSEVTDLSPAEAAEYKRGFDDARASGFEKDWF